ncbi:prepilin-type N-terminal cleavage/methylation domain-containing protein [bacterium]|nr:prepilin-type N-terminal cleavage/methylation domain-containing protein [bacterium]
MIEEQKAKGQEGKQVNPSPQPSPTRGEGVISLSQRERVKQGFTLAEVFSSHFAGRRKTAFTLAEVLITLGIIGIVAAMTLPSIFEKHRKQVAMSKLKKISSTLSQACKMASIDYGDDRDTFNAYDPDGGLEIFNRYYTPYMKINSIEKGQYGVFVYLLDGTALYYYKPNNEYMIACLTKKACKALDGLTFYDVIKSLGVERFTLYTCGQIPTYRSMVLGYTREELIQYCKDGTPISMEACSALIGGDGWHISDDYPLRF